MNKNYRVTIAHAVGSETGGITGKPGDQTGREARIQAWDLSGDAWDGVLRAKDAAARLLIAQNAETGARNPHLGYSQKERYTAYDIVKAYGYNYNALNANASTDCSQMATTCANFAGYSIPKDTCSGNMKERYLATKGFDLLNAKKYRTDYKDLLPGDILYRSGHHAAIVINNIYWLQSELSRSNSSGRKTDVKALQTRLNEINGAGLQVDGAFGAKTEQAVKNLQYNNGLKSDGVVGRDTALVLGFVFA